MSDAKKMRKLILPFLQRMTILLGGVAGTGGFVVLVLLAFRWAETTDHFRLKKIEVSGNRSLEREEILDLVKIPEYESLDDIDQVSVQKNLEGHPYVKAARVSRDFPSTLSVDIVERKPVAYVNHEPFLMVDDDGFVLPLKEGDFEFDIPTLSGFNPASELYPGGEKCLSRKVLETVQFLNELKSEFPRLYEDISEVKIDPDDEYVLYLTHYPTKVFIGSTPSAPKIRLLRQFSYTITGTKTLHDFKYVDLRYENQIIVRERS